MISQRIALRRFAMYLPLALLACGGRVDESISENGGTGGASFGIAGSSATGGAVGSGGQSAAGTLASCDDLAAAALAKFNGIVIANSACKVDADCSVDAIANEFNCFFVCGVAYATQLLHSLWTTAGAADLCGVFNERGCPLPRPPDCLGSGVAFCNNGLCTPKPPRSQFY